MKNADDRGTTGLSFTSNNAPDIGVNPINGLLIVVRTMETERIKREGGERRAGVRTGERCRSEEAEKREDEESVEIEGAREKG